MANRVIVLFSGGIDSTAALHRVLTEWTDYQPIVHHVKLFTSENRQQAEAMAVKRILGWYKENGFNFNYVEMEFKTPYPIWDAQVYGMTAGAMAMMDKGITHFATGATYTTYNESGENIYPGPGESSFTEIVSDHAGRDIWPLPVFRNKAGEFLSKQEAWDYVPDEIKPYIWSCRRPRYNDIGAFRCGECLTCAEMKKIEPKPANHLSYPL
jgi:hypothetical protein